MILKTLIAIMVFTLNANVSRAAEPGFLTPYAALLAAHVTPLDTAGITTTGVDYRAWQQDERHHHAMHQLLRDHPENYPRREQKISFWVNAYNLLVIDLIITMSPQHSIQHVGGIIGDPWNMYSWRIGGTSYSLDEIVQDKIRPLGEPRAHFALTCGALSCPPLKDSPYYAKRIYSQLETQTASFLTSSQGVQLHSPKNRNQLYDQALLSPIFIWYASDFNGGDLTSFIASYLNIAYAEVTGEIPFNWALNARESALPDPALKHPITHYEEGEI